MSAILIFKMTRRISNQLNLLQKPSGKCELGRLGGELIAEWLIEQK